MHQEGDGVGDMKATVVVCITGLHARWRGISQKEKSAKPDAIGDVDLGIGVGVAAAEGPTANIDDGRPWRQGTRQKVVCDLVGGEEVAA